MSEQELTERLENDLRKLALDNKNDSEFNDASNPNIIHNPYMGGMGFPMLPITSPDIIKEQREGKILKVTCPHIHSRPSTEFEIEKYCFDDSILKRMFGNRRQRDIDMYNDGIISIIMTNSSIRRAKREFVTYYISNHDVDIIYTSGTYICRHKSFCKNNGCVFEG